MMSIAAVERDTGLSKDTLRVWEKRYGFPLPVRDGQGERSYPLDQIERLRLIKRLLDVGHRPGRVAELPLDDLQALAERSAEVQGQSSPDARHRTRTPDTARLTAAPLSPQVHHPMHPLHPDAPWVDACLDRVDAHDPPGLRMQLSQGLMTLGLARFVTELASPLLHAMGEGWLRGRYQIPQEHWVSHQLQQVLHSAIHSLGPSQPQASPRVLLSTFPGEPHSMGLLMVEAWLALLQAQALNLGPQTPLWDLIQAASQYRVDAVALSFTASAPAALVQDTLAEFRAKLPAHIAVWAGGPHPLLLRRPPEGVTVLHNMDALSQAVQACRAQTMPGAQPTSVQA